MIACNLALEFLYFVYIIMRDIYAPISYCKHKFLSTPFEENILKKISQERDVAR